jgi:hypothetical protein
VCCKNPDCDALFTVEVVSGNTVLIKNASTSAESSALNFGDGSPFYFGVFDTVTHTYATAGIYQICLEISNFAGCCTDKYCFLVNLTSAASEPDVKAIQVEISPNPAGEQARVSVAGANPRKAQLFDVFGKKVREKDLFDSTFEIETGELPAGFYLLQVWTEKGIVVRKLVVAR